MPQRHLDLTREELLWLHRLAFDRDIVGTDRQACDAIVMQKGFAWAREKIDARRNAIASLKGDKQ